MDGIKGDDGENINTHRAYARTFKEFFDFKICKSINTVIWEDLEAITNVDFIEFRNHQRKRGLIKTSVNLCNYHLRWLWRMLARENNNINATTAIVEPYQDRRDQSKLGSDTLEWEEIENLIEYAKSVDFHPEIQALFFEFATVAPLRYSALKKISWNCLSRGRYKDQDVWVASIWDKGVLHKHMISDDLYDRLQVLKSILHKGFGMKNQDDDPIFYISRQKIMETIDGFKAKYGINKWITPHSLKKGSARAVYEITQDIMAVKAHTNHKTIGMPVKYADSGEELSPVAAHMFEDRKMIKDRVLEMSKEELLEAIGKCNYGVMHQIATV
jgi:site-specific recombinase XerC